MWKKRVVWVLLCVLSVIAISMFGGSVSYVFLYTCFLLPFISGLYLFYVHMRFSIYQQLDTRNMTSGRSVPYSFILQNEDITVYTGIEVTLYSTFSEVEHIEDGKQFRLFPGDRVQFDTKLTCKYRGEYDVGVKEIIVYDFLGLFCIRYKIPSAIRALVSPRVVEVEDLKSVPELRVVLESISMYEKTQLDVVTREYHLGDSMKKIHWKASAREQELRVRNEIGQEQQGIVIWMDTERISEKMDIYIPVENKMLEVAIALLYYFSKKHMSTRILWQTGEVVERTCVDIQMYEEIFRELSGVYFQRNRKAEDVMKIWNERGSFLLGRVIFWILHDLDEAVYWYATQLAKEERDVVLYVVTEKELPDYQREYSTRLHIITIAPKQELDEVL